MRNGGVSVLIEGGAIVDGTGNPSFRGSVIVVGDTLYIARGSVADIQAQRIIDARDRIVCPGFIDVHTHSDLIPWTDQTNDAKVRQGVTTEIVANCGIGFFPLNPDAGQLMHQYWSGLFGLVGSCHCWGSVGEYLEECNGRASNNIACLIPHGSVRASVVGWGNRPASEEEIDRMSMLVREGLEEGAVGLSTGLSYPPGIFADTRELVALCRPLRRYGGVYATHARHGLGDGKFDGYREALEIARNAGCPVQFSHYLATPSMRGQTSAMTALVDAARLSGIDVTFDSYPYDWGSSVLHMILPPCAHADGPQALLQRLRDMNIRAQLQPHNLAILGNLERVRITAVATAEYAWSEGLTLQEISERMGQPIWDAACDLMVSQQLGVGYSSPSGNMRDVMQLLQHPAHMFGSDSLRAGSKPNARTYGTYPKILGELTRDKKVLSMETAIRKMTSLPASRFGICDRGLLRDGAKADLVVFDPLTVSGLSTVDEPRQYPLGIQFVLVNGRVVVDEGQHTGCLAGRGLRFRG